MNYVMKIKLIILLFRNKMCLLYFVENLLNYIYINYVSLNFLKYN